MSLLLLWSPSLSFTYLSWFYHFRSLEVHTWSFRSCVCWRRWPRAWLNHLRVGRLSHQRSKIPSWNGQAEKFTNHRPHSLQDRERSKSADCAGNNSVIKSAMKHYKEILHFGSISPKSYEHPFVKKNIRTPFLCLNFSFCCFWQGKIELAI